MKSETEKFIKTSRLSLQITQKEFGKLLGKTPAEIHRYENGKTLPNSELIFQIQKLLNDNK